MARPLIQISDVHKDFPMGKNIVHALDSVNLEIEANTFTVVMGPSGSGKSTLLYLLGGLDRPTQGSIVFKGREINELDENALAVFRRRTVGFIFQSFNLIHSMSALDNVSFPLRFSRASKNQRDQRAMELLTNVGLSDRTSHSPAELSGGEQQRVAIARAMIHDPDVILADEPTGNLDTATSVSIMRLLSDLHQKGKTVVVVTHDARMKSFATNQLYLLDGKIVSEDMYNTSSVLALQS